MKEIRKKISEQTQKSLQKFIFSFFNKKITVIAWFILLNMG